MNRHLCGAVGLIATFVLSIEPVQAQFQSSSSYRQDVIYGDDDRVDVYAETDPERKILADSTAAIVRWSDLSLNSQGRWSARTEPFSSAYGLCEDEPFYHQPTLANCSAFLVADDLVATAGHCISASSCDSYAFVFGFRMENENSAVTEFTGDNVYQCKEVIISDYTRAEDYALVRLDRKVQGRWPLKIRSQGKATQGDDLFVIGHPMGLPTKIAGGAKVRSWSGDAFFVANLDTYGGNSGSAVFNSTTKEVEGILVRGEQDMVQGACTRSKECADDACRGEDVTNISYIRQALSSLGL